MSAVKVGDRVEVIGKDVCGKVIDNLAKNFNLKITRVSYSIYIIHY